MAKTIVVAFMCSSGFMCAVPHVSTSLPWILISGKTIVMLLHTVKQFPYNMYTVCNLTGWPQYVAFPMWYVTFCTIFMESTVITLWCDHKLHVKAHSPIVAITGEFLPCHSLSHSPTLFFMLSYTFYSSKKLTKIMCYSCNICYNSLSAKRHHFVLLSVLVTVQCHHVTNYVSALCSMFLIHQESTGFLFRD